MDVFIGDWKKDSPERDHRIIISDSDVWSLDCTLSMVILPALIKFKEKTQGYPYLMTEEGWNEVLDKMITGFDLHVNDMDWNDDDEKREKVQLSIDLFGKHYLDLWS